MLARIALIVLCSMWGLTAAYEPELVAFVRGVGWDSEEDVRQIAISILGRHLRDSPDSKSLALLLDVADDPLNEAIIREDAVRALAVAEGMDRGSMPPASRRESLDSDWSRAILMHARSLVRAGH